MTLKNFKWRFTTIIFKQECPFMTVAKGFYKQEIHLMMNSCKKIYDILVFVFTHVFYLKLDFA